MKIPALLLRRGSSFVGVGRGELLNQASLMRTQGGPAPGFAELELRPALVSVALDVLDG